MTCRGLLPAMSGYRNERNETAMTNNRLLHVLLLSTAFLGLGTVAAHSQTATGCAPFTITSSQRTAHFLDLGDEGPGSGDVRIGHRALVDEAGNRVGDHRLIDIYLDTPPGSGEVGEAYMIHVVKLADGEIYYHSLSETVAPPHDTAQRSVGDFTGVVVGGTGAYRFARGTVDQKFDGPRSTYTFDIRCD